MINIAGLKKSDVLAALYNNTFPRGAGMLQARPDITEEEAAEAFGSGDDLTRMFGKESKTIRHRHSMYFDYLFGRPLKVDLEGDEFDETLYDRDAGKGVAAKAIATLRSKEGS